LFEIELAMLSSRMNILLEMMLQYFTSKRGVNWY